MVLEQPVVGLDERLDLAAEVGAGREQVAAGGGLVNLDSLRTEQPRGP